VTFSWSLGRLTVVSHIGSTMANSSSFIFSLPRVISCSGLLSYFQINYFQDSYSHIYSRIPLLVLRVICQQIGQCTFSQLRFHPEEME
jgi:hypothetical protein